MRVSLSCYSFQIHPKGHPKDFLRFNELPGVNKLFRDALRNYLNHLQGNIVVQEDACHQIEYLKEDGDTFHGKFSSGDYGHRSNFRDVNTKELTFVRTPSNAEQIPYHFLFSFADDANKGILITQKFGVRSVHLPLRTIIRKYLSDQFDVSFELNDFVPPEIYDHLKKGDKTKVTFNNVKLPHDQAKMLEWNGLNIEDVAEVQIIVRSKKGRVLELADIALDRYTSIIERRIEDNSSDATGISVEVKYSGSPKTVRLDKPDAFSPVIDISEHVAIIDGQPLYEDILNQSETVLQELKRRLTGL